MKLEDLMPIGDRSANPGIATGTGQLGMTEQTDDNYIAALKAELADTKRAIRSALEPETRAELCGYADGISCALSTYVNMKCLGRL